jgi:MFS family permease
MVGVFTGPLYDAGYFRQLVAGGGFLIPFGFFMTSLCKTYWQVILAQGVCIGLGNGLLFVPSVAILPQYFTTHKALANGIAASGSSFGGIVYPIVLRQLYPRIGFPWATRVMGFIALATAGFSFLIMRPRIMPKQKRHLTDLAAFKEPPYTLFCIGMFFGFVGFYSPVYYLSTYAISKGITDENLGFYLLPILNAASIAGRIVPNILTDKIGPLNVLIPASFATGILAFGWIGINSVSGIIIFAILYGFFSGGFVSLPPVAIITLSPDIRKIGTRYVHNLPLHRKCLLVS